MAKVGDTFAFPLAPGEWLSGRVLLDVNAQCVKTKRLKPDSALGFYSKTCLVEIYATATAQPEVRAEQILFPSMFTYDSSRFEGGWKVLGNVDVDPTRVDFPAGLIHHGVSPHLSWGELSLPTTLTPEEADAIGVGGGGVHGAGLVPAMCMVALGRGGELDPVVWPNLPYLSRASSDLRHSPHAERVFAAAGLANRDTYYEEALARGFDLARFYGPAAIRLVCPYCWGSFKGDRFCPHCGGDTNRDAIIELTPEDMARERRTTCIACKRPVFVLPRFCQYCRAQQPESRLASS